MYVCVSVDASTLIVCALLASSPGPPKNGGDPGRKDLIVHRQLQFSDIEERQ